MAYVIPYLYYAFQVILSVTASVVTSILLAPKVPDVPNGQQTIRSPIPTRVRGWGRCRVYGAIMLDEAFGGNLYRVLAMADGPIDGIERLYLNDDLVYLDLTSPRPIHGPGGWVAGGKNSRYHPTHVWIEYRLGVVPEMPYDDLAVEQPTVWSRACLGSGIFSAYIKCVSGKSNDNPGLFPYGKPDLSAVARLSLAYDWRLDTTAGGDGPQRLDDPATWAFSRNPIVCLVNELWRFRGYDWNTRFAPNLALLTAEANVCDEPVPVLNNYAELIQLNNHGDTSIVITNANGLVPGSVITIDPNVTYSEAVTVSSVEPYDSGYYAQGWTVHLTGPLAHDHSVREPVNWTSNPANPTMEPRYTCDCLFSEDMALADVINLFRTACDGFIARDGRGAMVIKAGHYEAPIVTLTAEDIVDYTWSSFVEDSQAVNELRPKFTFPAADYRQVETDAWQDADDIEARGETLAQSLELISVQATSQARRLAKRKMAQLLASGGTFTCKLSAVAKGVLFERYIGLQMQGEADELADIVLEQVDDPIIADDGMTVRLTVVAADVNVDAWNYITEEGEGPIIAARADVASLDPPVITSATAFFESNGTSGDGVRLEIQATGPDRSDLIWFAQTRVEGAASWVSLQYADLADGAPVLLETGFVTANASIEVQIAYQTGGGSISPYSASSFVDTSTANIAPEVATNIAAVGAAGSATISWRDPTSANFAGARVWQAPHGSAFATATDASGLRVGSLGANDSFTVIGLAPGDYDFWVTTENATGVLSPPDGPVEATAT